MSSADMVKNDYLAQFQDFPAYQLNAEFFSNCLQSFALGDVLMQIRRKTLTVPKFEEGSEDSITWINWVNYGIVPLLVAILGILRVVARSRASVAYERREIEKQRAYAKAATLPTPPSDSSSES